MAYKVFTNGSVLNASEINDNLMNQAIAVFSNSAARSAAITSPVEGQVTYLEDTAAYESFDGSSWIGFGGGGKILQVVPATKTDTFSASVAGANTYSTDAFTLSITPTSASSTIFVSGHISFTSSSGTGVAAAALFRNGTIVLQGDAAGSRGQTYMGRTAPVANGSQNPVGFSIVDSPATTSAITYSIRLASDQAATVYLNRSQADTNGAFEYRSASSMVAMEVAN